MLSFLGKFCRKCGGVCGEASGDWWCVRGRRGLVKVSEDRRDGGMRPRRVEGEEGRVGGKESWTERSGEGTEMVTCSTAKGRRR